MNVESPGNQVTRNPLGIRLSWQMSVCSADLPLSVMLLGDLVLGRGQPLPQLTFVKLLVGAHGLPNVRHSEILNWHRIRYKKFNLDQDVTHL